MLAPTNPWPLRGYRLFLDDVARVWAILGTGEGLARRQARNAEPGSMAGLDALLKGMAEGESPARVILVHGNGTGSDASDLADVARPDVLAFTIAGPGATFHVHRGQRSGFIEWQDSAVGYDVLQALEPRALRSWWPVAWKPYRVTFIPATKDDHQKRVKQRWAITGVIAAVVSAVVGLIALF